MTQVINTTGITVHQNVFGGVEVKGGDRSDVNSALEATGLNFKVEKRPLYLSDRTKVPDATAIVRTDTKDILGVVGNKYRPVQNEEAFGVFREAFDSGLLEIELAGQIGGGKIIWIQAKVVGDPLVVTGDDRVHPYVLLANSHDGSVALRAGFTAIRLFCHNQMAAATRQGSLVSLKHTRNVNLESLRTGIAAGQENLAKVVESAKYLSTKTVPNDEALNVFTRRSFNLNPEEPCRLDEKIQDLFEAGIGASYAPIKGSWWAAYNAVTEHLTHHRGRNADTRAKSLWFGDSAKVVGRSLEVAIEMAA